TMVKAPQQLSGCSTAPCSGLLALKQPRTVPTAQPTPSPTLTLPTGDNPNCNSAARSSGQAVEGAGFRHLPACLARRQPYVCPCSNSLYVNRRRRDEGILEPTA